MARVDLHIHSKYSNHPTEWFLQRIGTSESYTEPEEIYRAAKKLGMDFVTITDHNAIEGSLQICEAHPEDTFPGVESTVYFPEDRCKAHVLVYGFTESQFAEIQELRQNIYEFKKYLLANKLPHSLAHPTYSMQGVLKQHHLEKLLLLFDVCETINGGRNARMNNHLTELIDRLSPENFAVLKERHDIAPVSETPWIKGRTAGSDDHGGLFIAKTYTATDASTPAEFLEQIRLGKTTVHGRHHDYSSMAFSIFKIAYQFAKKKQANFGSVPLRLVFDLAFKERKTTPIEDLAINFLGRKKTVRKKKIRHIYGDLVRELKQAHETDIESKLDILYERVTALSDSLIADLVPKLKKSLRHGNLDLLSRTFATSLPMVFLTAPFLTAFNNMYNNRRLVDALESDLGHVKSHATEKILWFTDTLCDLNGVAYSLVEIGNLAAKSKHPMKLVTTIGPEEDASRLPAGTIVLPMVTSFPIPEYEQLEIKVPSLLHALRIAQDFDPDIIYVSSPSLVGLLGLLISRLMQIECVAVYHTDFSEQASKVYDDPTVTHFLDQYLRWFYGACESVKVNTPGYQDILARRGYDTRNMSVFHRGIDTDRFRPIPNALASAAQRWSVELKPFVFYAGRISKDKSIELLIEAFLATQIDDLNLVVAGDGPDLADLQRRYKKEPRIAFLGRVAHHELPVLYSAARLFAFPSTTDTFGRVVLEALACGSPVLVSKVGGPREIIDGGRTGFEIDEQSIDAWRDGIHALSDRVVMDEKGEIAQLAHEYILKNYTLARFFERLQRHPA